LGDQDRSGSWVRGTKVAELGTQRRGQVRGSDWDPVSHLGLGARDVLEDQLGGLGESAGPYRVNDSDFVSHR
jgi:hypothetical protein